MSHRTQSLTPLTGLRNVVRELRYHEASRQTLGLLISILFAAIAQPISWLLYSATVFVLAGIAVRLWASGFIIKNEELATNGPYAFVRHPLYVGNILIILAFAAASGFWWTLSIVVAFLGFYYPTAIEYEDRKLSTKFEGSWHVYAKQTPTLLPGFSNRVPGKGGHWSMKKSLTTNKEPVIAAFLLSCFAYVYSKL